MSISLLIICILTMALDPDGTLPLAGSAAFMLGTIRPGPTPWPITGPAEPPMGLWGLQPCCMEPRIPVLVIATWLAMPAWGPIMPCCCCCCIKWYGLLFLC